MSIKRNAKWFSALLLLCLLSVSSAPISTAAAQEPYGHAALAEPAATYTDLDEDASQWDGYEEGSPVWEINNVASPSLDGRALRCALLGGGVAHSNIHCYRNLSGDSTSDLFSFSLAFQYQPASTFNNDGGPSIVQALEFSMSKWENGQRYEWALQWENVAQVLGDGAPQWRYWNPLLPQDQQWVKANISGQISGMEWHRLTLEGEISNGQVHYRRFIFDGQEYSLAGIKIDPAPAPGVQDKFAVAVQLDGNATMTPYEVFVDDVTLTTSQTFADAALNYWAFDWIKRLYAANITGGCGVNPLRYCPEDSVTRAQMAVFLLRGIHTSSYTPPAVGAGTGFGDVPVDYWSGAWIKQLAAEGITSGCGNGNYCPENPVTRAQMAVFLLRSKHGLGYTPPAFGAGTGFGDVPPDYWAAAWIKQLVTEGITSGCGSGNYCPEAAVTRAQMAVFLVRTFGLP